MKNISNFKKRVIKEVFKRGYYDTRQFCYMLNGDCKIVKIPQDAFGTTDFYNYLDNVFINLNEVDYVSLEN